MSESEKINWTPELLAECRNEKGVVLGMMSEEARRAIIANKFYVERFSMEGFWKSLHWKVDELHSTYRLSPSFTPPELAPKPYVDCPVWKTNDDILLYRTPLGNDKQLVTAASCTSFVGYVYADKMVSCHPRRDDFDCGIALAPIAVRFWTGTVGAK